MIIGFAELKVHGHSWELYVKIKNTNFHELYVKKGTRISIIISIFGFLCFEGHDSRQIVAYFLSLSPDKRIFFDENGRRFGKFNYICHHNQKLCQNERPRTPSIDYDVVI